MSPSLRHRLLNIVQSTLIILGMAAIAWVALVELAGPVLTAGIVGGSLIGLMLAARVPRRMLLSAYKAQRLDSSRFPQGIALAELLAKRADLPRPPALYWIPSEVPNAFAIGNPDDSAVCFTDGILRLLDRREFTAVLAHEISHIAHRDLWIMGLADMMSRAVSLVSWFGQLLLLVNLPAFLMGRAMVPWTVPLILIFAPTLMSLLQLALSRTREYDADRGAVDLTGDPDALASALGKLERRVGRFWEEIILPGRRIPEPSLLRTHPPTEARIARLASMKTVDIPTASPLPVPAPLADVTRPPRFRRSGVWY